MTLLLIATSPRSTWITSPDQPTADAVSAVLGDRAYEVHRKGVRDALACDVGIGVEALEAGELLIAAGYSFAWHEDQHPADRGESAWGVPVGNDATARDDDAEEVVSYGDAKKSIGRMIQLGAFWLDPEGLHCRRDAEAYPDQVDVDRACSSQGVGRRGEFTHDLSSSRSQQEVEEEGACVLRRQRGYGGCGTPRNDFRQDAQSAGLFARATERRRA